MTVHDRPFGRHFEDFEVGDIYKHWPGKTITEYDDHLFCMITMNHHPLHTNDWFAENETPQGKNVVVGNLVYSLVLGMSVPDVSGCAPSPTSRSRRCSTSKPTFHGDTIYAETRVLDKQSDVEGRPRHRHRRDQGHQPARRRGLLLQAQGHGVDARARRPARASLRRRHLGLRRARRSTASLPAGFHVRRPTRSASDRPPRACASAAHGSVRSRLVVDLAAGTGIFTGSWSRGRRRRRGRAGRGDAAPAGRRHPGRSDVAGTAESLPFRDGSSTRSRSLRRSTGSTRPSRCARCARVLRPGGCWSCIWNTPRPTRCRGWRRSTASCSSATPEVTVRGHRLATVAAPDGAFDGSACSTFENRDRLLARVLVEGSARRATSAVAAPADAARVLDAVRELARTHPDLAGSRPFASLPDPSRTLRTTHR